MHTTERDMSLVWGAIKFIFIVKLNCLSKLQGSPFVLSVDELTKLYSGGHESRRTDHTFVQSSFDNCECVA